MTSCSKEKKLSPLGKLVEVSEQIGDSDSISRRLRGVSRTDPFLGRSKLGFALRSFGLLKTIHSLAKMAKLIIF